MSHSGKFRLAWVWLLIAICTISARGEDDPGGKQNTVLKSFPAKASQGVAVDGKHFYAISNTVIRKHDKETGKEIAVWLADTQLEGFRHFLHLNSGTVIDGKLYCAHSRFPIATNECTVEVWDVAGEKLEHLETIPMPADQGSLTWIDRRGDGSWWLCYASYGAGKNKATKLVKCRFADGKFIAEESYPFPAEVVANWGAMSCSGGSWGPDGLLYTTGHDRAEAYVLRIIDEKMVHLRTEKNLGLFGQAIAWDRFSEKPALWGIVKNKGIHLTRIPAANVNLP